MRERKKRQLTKEYHKIRAYTLTKIKQIGLINLINAMQNDIIINGNTSDLEVHSVVMKAFNGEETHPTDIIKLYGYFKNKEKQENEEKESKEGNK